MSTIHSIYTQMVEAGVEISNHESDLYVPNNETTRAIIAEYEHKNSVTRFNCYDDPNDPWFDIPFAFDPWWEQRGMSGTYVNKRTPNIDTTS